MTIMDSLRIELWELGIKSSLPFCSRDYHSIFTLKTLMYQFFLPYLPYIKNT